MPYERVILLILAALGALAVGWAGVLAWVTCQRAIPASIRRRVQVLIVSGVVLFVSLAWADVVRHYAIEAILGYPDGYNPYVVSMWEWEGGTGPTTGDPASRAAWDAAKCGPPPGGSAHPLMPWWGNPGSSSWCKQKGAQP